MAPTCLRVILTHALLVPLRARMSTSGEGARGPRRYPRYMNETLQADVAALFGALLEAVDRGELEAETPMARGLLRQIEGAAVALEAVTSEVD